MWGSSSSSLPYLKESRLPDVIAAVQFMAAAPRPERAIPDWTKDLSGEGLSDDKRKKEIDRWMAVFNEHPEFFLVYTRKEEKDPKAALRVRYANKLYDHKTGIEYTEAQRDKLSLQDEEQRAIRNRLTSKPLSTEAIAALMTTAIALHARANEERTARRWWIPVLAAVLAFFGAVAGAYFASHK